MKRIILCVFIGVLAFSCRTKKIIYNRKSNVETRKVEKPKVVIPKVETRKVETRKVVIKNEDKEEVKHYADATERYINTYKEVAINEMKLYHIPASITIAQGILESGSGNGRLSVEANNHFGIKCHDWLGAKIYHDDDASQECFRKYKDAKYSFRDHSLFLKERSRYSKLFDLKQEDYKGWARGLKAAGYATDVKYPQKLIDLIERYNLHKLDHGIIDKQLGGHKPPPKVKSINGKHYEVKKGDTLYSISRKFNLTVEELKKLNGLNDTSLSIGQQLKVK